MRQSICLALFGSLFLASFVAAEKPTTAPAQNSRERIQLFNGTNLDGWSWHQRAPKPGTTAPASAPIHEVWTVKDGILRTTGKPTGYIRTDTEYANYILTVEQRHVRKGNGGILFAITGPDKVWPKCLEVQAATGEQGDIRNIADFKLDMDQARVEPKRLKRLGPDPEKPVGEWETIVITVDHGRLAVSVNGQLQNSLSYSEPLTGKIGLQSEGGEIEYRKVELTPIE